MATVAKYTDYAILSPDYFITFIKNELSELDIAGISNNRFQSIRVSGEHPLVSLTGSILQSGTPNFQGIFPSVAVVESDESEDVQMIGQGIREGRVIDSQFFDDMALLPDMRTRILEGMITDQQIEIIRTAMEQNGGQLHVTSHTFRPTEQVYVSLWANNLEERKILDVVLRSVLYRLKLEMIKRDAREVELQTSRGLVNFDFGKMLFGQETRISYINKFSIYTVSTDVPPGYGIAEGDLDVRVDGTFESTDGSSLPTKIYGGYEHES